MPTVPELLDQILAHRVNAGHRPCFTCNGRGVVAHLPQEVIVGDGTISYRHSAVQCPECEGKKRIEARPDDVLVIAAVYGEIIALLVMLREDERFAEANAVLDWAADYQKMLRAKAAHDDPEAFKRVIAENLDLAEKLASGENIVEDEPAQSTSALTQDELRELGLEDEP